MAKTKHYEMLYRRNELTDQIIIDILLENYLEFFHEWDNSSFKKRDIHVELAQFLDMCSIDIPLRKKLEIVFTLGKDVFNEEKEEQIRTSYRNYYASLQRLEDRKTKRNLRISTILLITALSLLTTYGLLVDVEIHSIMAKVLLESLLIGGWVFAWEAVHLLSIDTIEPLRRRREIKRFLEATISFQYKIN